MKHRQEVRQKMTKFFPLSFIVSLLFSAGVSLTAHSQDFPLEPINSLISRAEGPEKEQQQNGKEKIRVGAISADFHFEDGSSKRGVIWWRDPSQRFMVGNLLDGAPIEIEGRLHQMFFREGRLVLTSHSMQGSLSESRTFSLTDITIRMGSNHFFYLTDHSANPSSFFSEQKERVKTGKLFTYLMEYHESSSQFKLIKGREFDYHLRQAGKKISRSQITDWQWQWITHRILESRQLKEPRLHHIPGHIAKKLYMSRADKNNPEYRVSRQIKRTFTGFTPQTIFFYAAIGASMFRQSITSEWFGGAQDDPLWWNNFAQSTVSPLGLAAFFVFVAASSGTHIISNYFNRLSHQKHEKKGAKILKQIDEKKLTGEKLDKLKIPSSPIASRLIGITAMPLALSAGMMASNVVHEYHDDDNIEKCAKGLLNGEKESSFLSRMASKTVFFMSLDPTIPDPEKKDDQKLDGEKNAQNRGSDFLIHCDQAYKDWTLGNKLSRWAPGGVGLILSAALSGLAAGALFKVVSGLSKVLSKGLSKKVSSKPGLAKVKEQAKARLRDFSEKHPKIDEKTRVGARAAARGGKWIAISFTGIYFFMEIIKELGEPLMHWLMVDGSLSDILFPLAPRLGLDASVLFPDIRIVPSWLGSIPGSIKKQNEKTETFIKNLQAENKMDEAPTGHCVRNQWIRDMSEEDIVDYLSSRTLSGDSMITWDPIIRLLGGRPFPELKSNIEPCLNRDLMSNLHNQFSLNTGLHYQLLSKFDMSQREWQKHILVATYSYELMKEILEGYELDHSKREGAMLEVVQTAVQNYNKKLSGNGVDESVELQYKGSWVNDSFDAQSETMAQKIIIDMITLGEQLDDFDPKEAKEKIKEGINKGQDYQDLILNHLPLIKKSEGLYTFSMPHLRSLTDEGKKEVQEKMLSQWMLFMDIMEAKYEKMIDEGYKPNTQRVFAEIKREGHDLIDLLELVHKDELGQKAGDFEIEDWLQIEETGKFIEERYANFRCEDVDSVHEDNQMYFLSIFCSHIRDREESHPLCGYQIDFNQDLDQAHPADELEKKEMISQARTLINSIFEEKKPLSERVQAMESLSGSLIKPLVGLPAPYTEDDIERKGKKILNDNTLGSACSPDDESCQLLKRDWALIKTCLKENKNELELLARLLLIDEQPTLRVDCLSEIQEGKCNLSKFSYKDQVVIAVYRRLKTLESLFTQRENSLTLIERVRDRKNK